MNHVATPMKTIRETEDHASFIEVTISEVDRQTAGMYSDLNNCIICTALRNRGVNADTVGVWGAWIEGRRYLFTEGQTAEKLHADPWATVSPFYEPDVVGQTIKLFAE